MGLMITFTICVLSFGIFCALHSFIKTKEFYAKFTAFFYMCINLTIIILLSFLNNLHFIIDTVIILFLLELVIVLTFLSNKIRRSYD
jgi:hypothetical protein